MDARAAPAAMVTALPGEEPAADPPEPALCPDFPFALALLCGADTGLAGAADADPGGSDAGAVALLIPAAAASALFKITLS